MMNRSRKRPKILFSVALTNRRTSKRANKRAGKLVDMWAGKWLGKLVYMRAGKRTKKEKRHNFEAKSWRYLIMVFVRSIRAENLQRLSDPS